MNLDESSSAAPPEPDAATYVPPRVERLGSLAELTQGGSGRNDDTFGGAGDEGSV